MGHVYTLSGPSGVGKTTFLNLLLKRVNPNSIKLIPRFTTRPRRSTEKDGFEYFFINHNNMLKKVFENDFIHFEKWGDFYSAIETSSIEESIDSSYDSIILASTFGSSRLKATYDDKIIPIYMWSGDYNTLYNPSCLSPVSDEVIELKWRIRKKLIDDGFSEFETVSLSNDEFLEKRMIDNYLDIAAVNGKLKSKENYFILSNQHDKIEDTVDKFIDFTKKKKLNK